MSRYIPTASRARDVQRAIEGNPSSIVFTRPAITLKTGGTPAVILAPQTVRISADNRATVIGGASGVAPKRVVYVYGVIGHPTQPDNDIKIGYTFPYQGETYRVVDILPGTPGEIQAQATSAGGANG